MAEAAVEQTAFAIAWADAEERKRQAEAKAEAAALAAVADHVYDPLPYPDAEPDARLYAGTGIGALYGLPGSEWALAELGDWTIGKEPQ